MGDIQLVKQIRHFLDHIVIDISVSGERLGAFAMSGELSYKVRVFDFLVEIADECASCHVRAGHVANRVLLRLLGDWVDDCNNSVYAGLFHRIADKAIEFSGADEREQAVLILAFVSVQNLDGGRGKVHFYYARAFFFRFARDVMDCNSVFVLHDIVFRESEEVADSTPDIALKYENIACSC